MTIIPRQDIIEVMEKDGVAQVCATLLTEENTERNIVARLESMDDTGFAAYFNSIC